MSIFKGILQSPFSASSTSLRGSFAALPPVSSRCAPASDGSWRHLQPSEPEGAGAATPQAAPVGRGPECPEDARSCRSLQNPP